MCSLFSMLIMNSIVALQVIHLQFICVTVEKEREREEDEREKRGGREDTRQRSKNSRRREQEAAEIKEARKQKKLA